jgi:quercetin dioxygenase-like cupin family protein
MSTVLSTSDYKKGWWWQMISVLRAGGEGPSSRAEGTIVGDAWRDAVLPPTDGIAIGRVFFAPGARTNWHRHESGQLLIVVAGEGFVADADGAVRVVEGDMIWTPPGHRHWHGAAPNRFLLHTAIALGTTEWLEAVNDAEYSESQ